MKKIIEMLQFFADAGTNVNATGAYVNAYNGNTESFSGANTLSPEMKDFYDTELLENSRTTLKFAQFGKKQRLPKNHKGKVEWRKFNTFAPAGKLQEGVIPTGQKFGVTAINGSIDQYGTYVAISDKLELRAYDDVVGEATVEMGASAAETQEKLTRDALATNANVFYCDNIAANGSVVSTPTKIGEIAWDATAGYSKLTPTMINKVVTALKKDKVPKINGKYYAVIHPSVAFDLRESEGWIEAHKYAAPEQLFNGEIGELHGVRFIEDEFAPVMRGSIKGKLSAAVSAGAATTASFDGVTVEADALIGKWAKFGGNLVLVTDNTTTGITFASTTLVAVADDSDIEFFDAKAGSAYATYFFGLDSFGIIDPEGGSLEMIIHDKDEIGGPLNQFSTIGYKFETNGATVLYPERMVRVMSGSAFSDVDEDN